MQFFSDIMIISLHSFNTSQVHFDQDQFENRRIDGKRKLKWNAVPTIFSQCITPKHRKSSMKQSLPETCKKKADHPDHTYSEHQQNDNVWSDCKCSSFTTVLLFIHPKNEPIYYYYSLSR